MHSRSDELPQPPWEETDFGTESDGSGTDGLSDASWYSRFKSSSNPSSSLKGPAPRGWGRACNVPRSVPRSVPLNVPLSVPLSVPRKAPLMMKPAKKKHGTKSSETAKFPAGPPAWALCKGHLNGHTFLAKFAAGDHVRNQSSIHNECSAQENMIFCIGFFISVPSGP